MCVLSAQVLVSRPHVCRKAGPSRGSVIEVEGGREATNVPTLALWGPEDGRAVTLRELAKNEEVMLLGSQLCQSPQDLLPLTTLISATISPFISSSFSSSPVSLSLIVLGVFAVFTFLGFPPFYYLCFFNLSTNLFSLQ